MCSASTAYASIKESKLRPGQWAVFPGGGGGVGIQGVQLAVAMGLRVIVVDTGAERKDLCGKTGAEHFIDFNGAEDPAAEVLKLTGGGAHGVFVTGELAVIEKAILKLTPRKLFNRIRSLSSISVAALVAKSCGLCLNISSKFWADDTAVLVSLQ